MRTPKSTLLFIAVGLLAGASANAAPLGSAFAYQGRLTDNGALVNGIYDLRFTLYDTASGGSVVGGPVTNSAVAVSNGLFTTAVDLGAAVFNGNGRWLETAARTNGSAASFSLLGPRQATMPTPYALMAVAASNLVGTLPAGQLSGTVGNSQLANSSLTVIPGAGLSGGGAVALGGSTTLNNAGVLSVTGNADITASPTNGNVALATTATSANAASAIVKRDASGSFAAGTITLSTNLNLPATTTAAGIIYAGGNLLLHSDPNANFFVGVNAGNLALTGSQNTGVGNRALPGNTSGSANTANGYSALYFNTSGSYNTANGCWALSANTNGNYNTANGCWALQANTSGNDNTASGYRALYGNTTGLDNTANGYLALFSNTNGSYNTASGSWALEANTSGGANTANGYGALSPNTTGNNNTASGAYALFSNTTGSRNTVAGAGALYSNTNGSYNTAIGYQALWTGAGGNGNVALGYAAGINITTGSSNVCIAHGGYSTDASTIRIGTPGIQTNTFVAGIHGVTSSGGLAVYVNSSGQLGTATSSRRFKQDIQDMGQASEVLLSLRPVTFRYRPEVDPQGIPQFGLVAEEVEQVDRTLVVRDDKDRVYTVRYEAVNAMLLNEFLKQHRKVEEQNARIEKLNAKAAKVDVLEKRLAELENLVQSLANRN